MEFYVERAEEREDVVKAAVPFPIHRTAFIVPGQNPKSQAAELERFTAKPGPVDLARHRLDFTDPVFTVQGVTKGLPLEHHVEKAFQTFVSGILKSSNEADFRKAVMQHVLYDLKEQDPTIRRALLQRSLALYKSRGSSPNTAIVHARAQGLRMTTRLEKGETFTIEKAEARGGNYHRRVTDEKTGKHRYFYSEDDYAKRPDAHLNGDDVKRSKARAAVLDAVGESGSSIDAMKGLSGKHDPEHIADAIRAHVKSGALVHKAGKLSRPKVEKAAPPVIISPEMRKQAGKARTEQLAAADIQTPVQAAADLARQSKKEDEQPMQKGSATPSQIFTIKL